MIYLVRHFSEVLGLFIQHLELLGVSLAIALAIALPLGVLISRVTWLRRLVITVLEIVYTIPSLSLFVLLIPLFGLGWLPAVIALVAYAQFMLVRNWTTGLVTIDPAILEAADGLGMSGWQRFWQIEAPLALPLLLAGVRLAAIAIIAIGTVAAFINAGGLGKLLFDGVITANYGKIFAGSLTVTVLALAANALVYALEKRVAY